jgi:hypothetical protein
MKKVYTYLVVILGLVFSCSSGGGDDAPEQPTVNTAPTVPVQVYPLNNTLCINNAIDFQWDASNDAENDQISYVVEISENSDFSSLTQTRTVNSNTTNITLEKGKSFYWRVKAIDNRDAESGFSSVSQFLTEGDGVSNHLPFVAELVAPSIDEIINGTSVTLSWTASDVDNDTLTFDVYLDTASDPVTKVSENQTGTAYNATSLTTATTYYFKVVVKDDKGGITIGQVWSFKTQ